MKKISTLLLIMTISTCIHAEEKLLKHNIKEEIKLSSEAKTVKVLSSSPFKFVGLGFKKGQVLEKHLTPTPAILIIQFGTVDFMMAGKTYSLNSGDYFEIPANVDHELIAKKDSYLYLIK